MKKHITILLLFIVVFTIAGCKSKEPQPEDRFAEYVKLWNDHKFNKMYDYLSTEAKEEISKEEFTNRYSKIYEDLEIENLSVKFNKPEEASDTKEEQIPFPFSVKMESLAGEIAFDHEATLLKEEHDETNNWFVNWDTTFIFPELENGDKISLPTISAQRGAIIDKNGIGLAETGQALEIGIVPQDMEGQEEEIIKNVSKTLDVSIEQIKSALRASWVQPGHFVPIKKVASDDTELLDQVLSIQAVQGMKVEARVYPLGEAAAHLTGNIGPITADELEKNKGKGYSSTDMIGKRGLEKVLEEKLKGEQGVKIVINKEDGSEVILAEKPVKDGENVQLTIDSTLQTTIYEEMAGKPGTATAINPMTGETLALVSSPSFNPNVLSLGATNEEWAALQDDPNKPLTIRFNKSSAPGSVIKPITAAIELNEGAIDWKKALDIKDLTWQKDASWGGYKVKRVSNPGVPIDLEKALIYSDNIYFAQTAIELGKDKFISGLKNFGFDEEFDFLYPMEVSQIGDIDSDIALADSSYGQGQIEMSPLHLASAYTPFMNKGNMIKPILQIDEDTGQVWKKNVVSEEEANNIHQALIKVVEDPNGTARGARIPDYQLAGKTGTAEFKEKQGEKGKENGWFVAYKKDNPDLLIALMVEGVEEGGGSGLAVDKVKNIFTKVK
ncbi:penicillin-binding transpeptidase domain-containing protein [Lederbergia lenta]|uniref:penicillin-binding transpeptidase domain-containing protein n=1 Tax=Lederbergia lenta TaxID=1467 RepID=UPI00203B9564|nr:penicillin-binding transpeptidase domain-containing protein [Lederbergia lenta]MCM3112543.1 penicillin-binding transpeptidase domain-containing protein [Lederbergia lenta]